jgi:hypothetical protein
MEITRKRRWWQFGLRWLFVAMLVVAAYATGRSHQNDALRRTNDQLRRALDMAKASREEATNEALAMKEKYQQERGTNGTLRWELRLLKRRLAAQPDISVFNFSTGGPTSKLQPLVVGSFDPTTPGGAHSTWGTARDSPSNTLRTPPGSRRP